MASTETVAPARPSTKHDSGWATRALRAARGEKPHPLADAAPSGPPASTQVFTKKRVLLTTRTGNYRVTFAYPETQSPPACPRCGAAWANETARHCVDCGQVRTGGGAFLDVTHLAGYLIPKDDEFDQDCAVILGTATPYVGPLAPQELEKLLALATHDRGTLGAMSYPSSWRITVEPVE